MRIAAFILADGEWWFVCLAISAFAGFLAAQQAFPKVPAVAQLSVTGAIVVGGFLVGYAGWRILSASLFKPSARGVVIPLLAALFVLVLYAVLSTV